ncbi:hypothetical protein M3O96_11880 [Aquiflexum sp. TKW24L]|uniref:hypothetical protein n=1 Tax=Aquiflexum sp. TKW24L TaxID=2942212 RepID=UPI0020BDC2F0|nr:hypothetical protein [Aquiflexum sp. TKW24L]MCL6259792.1 hypothetical protein [Aquiflexum sp. TKW24L]
MLRFTTNEEYRGRQTDSNNSIGKVSQLREILHLRRLRLPKTDFGGVTLSEAKGLTYKIKSFSSRRKRDRLFLLQDDGETKCYYLF